MNAKDHTKTLARVPICRYLLEPCVEELLDTHELVYSRRLFKYAHELINHVMQNKMTDFRDYDFVNFWSEFETGNLDFAFRLQPPSSEYTGGIKETY